MPRMHLQAPEKPIVLPITATDGQFVVKLLSARVVFNGRLVKSPCPVVVIQCCGVAFRFCLAGCVLRTDDAAGVAIDLQLCRDIIFDSLSLGLAMFFRFVFSAAAALWVTFPAHAIVPVLQIGDLNRDDRLVWPENIFENPLSDFITVYVTPTGNRVQMEVQNSIYAVNLFDDRYIYQGANRAVWFTFERPISGFGSTFFSGGGTGQRLSISTTSVSGINESRSIVLNSNGLTPPEFFGVRASSARIKTIAINLSGRTEGYFFGSLEINEAYPIPEPSTWAMLVLGFGVLGSTLRRCAPRPA